MFLFLFPLTVEKRVTSVNFNSQDGVFGWADFYFKCAEHPSQGETDCAVPLKQIKNNTRKIPCLACTEIRYLPRADYVIFLFK